MVAQPKIAEPTVVNGINVDDLFALIEGVKHDAASVMELVHGTSGLVNKRVEPVGDLSDDSGKTPSTVGSGIWRAGGKIVCQSGTDDTIEEDRPF